MVMKFSSCLFAIWMKTKKPVFAVILLLKQEHTTIDTVLYLILVQGVWLESFILISAWDVPVDEHRGVTSVAVIGVSAEQLIVKDFPIWLSRRGPGDQKSSL